MSGIQEFLDAAEKAAPVVLAQLTLSPNLLLFQLRAEAEPASLPGGDRTGRITFLIPAAWNEAGHADARASQAEAQILLQSRTRG